MYIRVMRYRPMNMVRPTGIEPVTLGLEVRYFPSL